MSLYYLDTNTDQSLGSKLQVVSPQQGVYTSMLTIMELLKRIEDEESFRKKRGPILQLLNSGVLIDPLPVPFVIQEAFGIKYEIPKEFDDFEKITAIACKSENYNLFVELIAKEGLIDIFEGLKLIFLKGNERFKDSLAQYNEKGDLTANRIIFKETGRRSITVYWKVSLNVSPVSVTEIIASYGPPIVSVPL